MPARQDRPRPRNPPRSHHRVPLRLQRQPRIPLGRQPLLGLRSPDPELHLRPPGPVDRHRPALGNWATRRDGNHHLRLRCPGPPRCRHRRRGQHHRLRLLRPGSSDPPGLPRLRGLDLCLQRPRELVSETDGRGVTTTRTVDAARRVTFVDSEENALDTAYTYDEAAVAFSAGRLTAITRAGQSIDYAYDRFGRTVQDGTLAYAYDSNGNRTDVTYPGGVAATTTHDYADREETLAVTDGGSGGGTTNLVTAAAYLPSGPLTSLALGNGLAETRSFDSRYFPSSITVPGRLDWTYSTDTIGNILEIADGGGGGMGGGDRTYTYQDIHYFLTSGTGPWGSLAFTYDKIGNRLSETRDAGGSPQNRPYAYPASPSGGNLPKLASITDPAGDRLERFFFDDAGNETYRATQTAKHRLSYDALGRMSQIKTDSDETAGALVTLAYDGRSFLREATRSPFPGQPATVTTSPTYSSDGLLRHKATSEVLGPDDPRGEGSATADAYVLYFAGRPAGILDNETVTPLGGTPTSTSTLTYLTTDHLGTPVLATDAGGATTWAGGFAPFGADWQAEAGTGASDAGVFLRFPGQWDDPAWGAVNLYYNVHRWYEPETGRYARVDPRGLAAGVNQLTYVLARPLAFSDPHGLQSERPPSGRDPFRPPFDPNFGSGPWGDRPDPNCCDQDKIAEALRNRQKQIDRINSGAPPEGVPQSFIIRDSWCDPMTLWCRPFPPDQPFDPPIPSGTDPCVGFCTLAHEWYHHTDNRPFHRSVLLDDIGFSRFRELPAYELEIPCLKSFQD